MIHNKDTYTKEILIKQFELHKTYVNKRKQTTKDLHVRMPSIPEDISENIIKFIIINKLNDETSKWNCKSGDLFSMKEGIQECKCFTSNAPLSFSPSSKWNVIYFLDARQWITNNHFKLFKINLANTDKQWLNIKINSSQTIQQQCKQSRRPRLCWDNIKKHLNNHISLVFEGTFEDIFIPYIIIDD